MKGKRSRKQRDKAALDAVAREMGRPRFVAESYFNGDDSDTLHDIRSATKSTTATLMGIAIQQHVVHSVEDSIADYLPNLPKDEKT